MLIGISVYEGVDLMDVTAPYEIFNWASAATNGVPPIDV
jgi:putative intracellular protease/amidase